MIPIYLSNPLRLNMTSKARSTLMGYPGWDAAHTFTHWGMRSSWAALRGEHVVSAVRFQQRVQKNLGKDFRGPIVIDLEGTWREHPEQWALAAQIARAVCPHALVGQYNGIRTSPFTGLRRGEPIDPEILAAHSTMSYARAYIDKETSESPEQYEAYVAGIRANYDALVPGMPICYVVGERYPGLGYIPLRRFADRVRKAAQYADSIMWFSSGCSERVAIEYGQALDEAARAVEPFSRRAG